PVLLGDLLKKGMRHLNEDAGPIARIGLAAAGTAVVEVTQDLNGLLQNAVGFTPLHIDDEAHAAGLVFVPGVIKTLLSRLPGGASRKALLTAVFVLHKRPPKGDWEAANGLHRVEGWP